MLSWRGQGKPGNLSVHLGYYNKTIQSYLTYRQWKYVFEFWRLGKSRAKRACFSLCLQRVEGVCFTKVLIPFVRVSFHDPITPQKMIASGTPSYGPVSTVWEWGRLRVFSSPQQCLRACLFVQWRLLFLICLFLSRVSDSLGWCWTHYVAKTGLELPILLSLSLECWIPGMNYWPLTLERGTDLNTRWGILLHL